MFFHIGFKVLLLGAKGTITIETTTFLQEWGTPVNLIWENDSRACQSERLFRSQITSPMKSHTLLSLVKKKKKGGWPDKLCSLLSCGDLWRTFILMRIDYTRAKYSPWETNFIQVFNKYFYFHWLLEESHCYKNYEKKEQIQKNNLLKD